MFHAGVGHAHDPYGFFHQPHPTPGLSGPVLTGTSEFQLPCSFTYDVTVWHAAIASIHVTVCEIGGFQIVQHVSG